jgi:hypothetical protein
MLLKFTDGLWDGVEVSASTAPQYVDLNGMMFGSRETSETTETAETGAMGKQTSKYQIVDVIETPGEEDVVHYQLAE